MTDITEHAAAMRTTGRRLVRTALLVVPILSCTLPLLAQSPPSNVGTSPLTGSGAAQTFSFTSSSPGGAGKVLWMEMLVNSGNVAAHGCFLGFWPGSNTVGLADMMGPRGR